MPQSRKYPFYIMDDGRLKAGASWSRDNEATLCRLMLTSLDVGEAEIAGWTDEQVKLVDEWAYSSALAASDNDEVKVPPRPDFLPDKYIGL